jgi:hypothetical protein
MNLNNLKVHTGILLIFLAIHLSSQEQVNSTPLLRGVMGINHIDNTRAVLYDQNTYFLNNDFQNLDIYLKIGDILEDIPSKIDVHNQIIIAKYKNREYAIDFNAITKCRTSVVNGAEEYIFRTINNQYDLFKRISSATNPVDSTQIELLKHYETSIRVANHNAGLNTGSKVNTLIGHEKTYIYVESSNSFFELSRQKNKLKTDIASESFSFTEEGYKNYKLKDEEKLKLFFNTINF